MANTRGRKRSSSVTITNLINTTINRLEVITNRCRDPRVVQDLNTLMIDLSVYLIPANNSKGVPPKGKYDIDDDRYIINPEYDDDTNYTDLEYEQIF